MKLEGIRLVFDVSICQTISEPEDYDLDDGP
jgi:hypothetical protein